MKKIFFLLAGFIFFSQIHAQSTLGVRVAYNNTTATKPVEYAHVKNIERFQVGIFGRLSVYKNIFLKGSLLYNQKGNIYDDDAYIADAGKRVTVKLNYLEASVDMGYAFKLIGKHKILVGVGPYLGYGISGTEKGSGESLLGQIIIDKKAEFTNSDYTDGTTLRIKPLDFGFNFNVGYQFRKYGVFFNYGLGLANRENLGDGYKSYNRVASVGVSYSFK